MLWFMGWRVQVRSGAADRLITVGEELTIGRGVEDDAAGGDMAAHVGASEDIGRIVRQLRRERLQRVALFREGRQVLGEVIERMRDDALRAQARKAVLDRLPGGASLDGLE